MILIIDVVVINYHNKNDDYFTIINAGDGILIVFTTEINQLY